MEKVSTNVIKSLTVTNDCQIINVICRFEWAIPGIPDSYVT